ncbi:hypothetical protein CHS0354_028001 [Potamilus streckersoni]|uniref:Uncharacterized protein n=1 Tax=Potamilus streckersoni TaxID=2493646 RepID=A0AAE0W7S4_9BIVA|nr:hypothetical protein CHS0354_028001 [Potamilus streckersoni]
MCRRNVFMSIDSVSLFVTTEIKRNIPAFGGPHISLHSHLSKLQLNTRSQDQEILECECHEVVTSRWKISEQQRVNLGSMEVGRKNCSYDIPAREIQVSARMSALLNVIRVRNEGIRPPSRNGATNYWQATAYGRRKLRSSTEANR